MKIDQIRIRKNSVFRQFSVSVFLVTRIKHEQYENQKFKKLLGLKPLRQFENGNDTLFECPLKFSACMTFSGLVFLPNSQSFLHRAFK